MPNTTQEDAMVYQALNQLATVYGDHLNGNAFLLSVLGAPRDQLFNFVSFMDDGPFRTNLMLTGKVPVNCQVNGSTDRQGTRYALRHAVVYINRTFATPGTVLHELLHALSHNDWYIWSAFKKPGLNEAVTEYFTRKVIKKTADNTFRVDRTGTYEDELTSLLGMKAGAKQASALPFVRGGRRGQAQAQAPAQAPAVSLGTDLRDAYFKGSVSPRLNDAMAFYQ